MKAGVVVTALVALVVSGCAAAEKGGPYAGVDQYDVGGAARDIIDQETSDRASRLYDKELTVGDLTKGSDPLTRRPAWVVSMENFDHVASRTCLYLWGKFTPFQGSSISYDVDDCPSGGT